MEVAIFVEIRIDDESNGGINWGLKVVENCHAYSAKRSGEVAPALVNPCPFYEYHELTSFITGVHAIWENILRIVRLIYRLSEEYANAHKWTKDTLSI